MKIFYISDLHLRSDEQPQAKRFVSFLELMPKSHDALVLGGDIFDLFVGNKGAFREKFTDVLQAIQGAAERGVSVFYLEGNHDFHLAGALGDGVEVYTDDFPLSVGKTKLWISHGDMIDQEDRGYRLLRKVTRSAPFVGFLKIFPGAWISAIGSFSSAQSRKYNNTERLHGVHQERIRGLYLDFARNKVREGYHHILVGHSHLPDQVPIHTEQNTGEYVNLGFASDYLPFGLLEVQDSAFSIRQFKL